MRYLFFDIECANCFEGVGKIFSFGYVLADESFRVIEQDDILMNPDVTRWDWYVLKSMMAYDRHIFASKPKFDSHYDRIAALFASADVIAGYAVENDVKFLLDECRRYQLPFFPHKFYDMQRILRAKHQLPNLISLKRALELLEIPEDEASTLHKSDDDALYTMRVAQALIRDDVADLPALIKKYPVCDVSVENGKVKLHCENGYIFVGVRGEERDPERLHRSSPHYAAFRELIKRPKPSADYEQILKGKKIIVNLGYEEHHRTMMMRLVKRIGEMGGRYTTKASEADIFLEGPCKKPHCIRYNHAMLAAANGKDICFIPIEDFFKAIGLEEA